YLLIGPHLAYMLDDLKQKVADKNVLVSIIPQATYGTLNGEKALDLILNMEG
ncbi:TPA_asm: PTS sugar transporter subunit IIB, partial [Listeria monocytogenes]|nr:PTS sugar transporter subunit IIB [Listeria monocytogenes]